MSKAPRNSVRTRRCLLRLAGAGIAFSPALRWAHATHHAHVGSRYLVLCGLVLAASLGLQVDPAAAPGRVLLLTLLLVLPFMLGGLGHCLVPPMIGASRMAFPMAAAAGVWLFLAAIALASVGVARQSAAWLDAASVLAAADAVLLAINHVATIVIMPARLATLRHAPFFVWGVLVASAAVLIFVPVLAGAATVLGLAWSFPHRSGSDANWLLLYPLAIITALPTVGVLADIVLPSDDAASAARVRARYGLLALGLFCVVLWAHGVLAQPEPATSHASAGEWVIAVGTALLVLALLPILREHGTLDAARLWVQGAVFVLLTAVAAEFVLLYDHVPDSFGHFQTALSLGCVFAGFGGLYRWAAPVLGRSIRETWGLAHFATGFVGVNLTLLPAHVVTVAPGLAGPMRSATFSVVHTVATGLTLLSLVVFVVGLSEALIAGEHCSQSADVTAPASP